LQPDLILIDIGLTSGSGFDVLTALQDHNIMPRAVKVVFSNCADAETTKRWNHRRPWR
jgi:DNA-binding NarL/FixJ family response regulator